MYSFDTLLKHVSAFSGDDDKLLETHKAVWEGAMGFNGEQLKELAEKLKGLNPDSPFSRCLGLLSEGFQFVFHPSYGNAFEKLNEANEAFQQVGDNGGVGAVESLLALQYKNMGQLDRAQQLVESAITRIGDNTSYRQFMSIAYYQGGEINYMLKDRDATVKYYNKGLEMSGFSTALSTRMLVGLANAHKDADELDLAFEAFQKALKQIEGKGITLLESKIFADLGNYYYRRKDYAQSVNYHQKSIEMRERSAMKNPLITNYIELAELYLETGKTKEALDYALKAESLTKELNIVLKLSQIYFILSNIYDALGETSRAFDYYKKYHASKEEVFSQETARQIKQLSVKHEMDSMQQEKELFRLKNVVLKEALDEIESSVRYARRIQEAILPPMELVKKKLSNAFILYKPKDVVAGDFYWMHSVESSEGANSELTLIAAADCTGHGVPGAMVSIVCSNALNRAVKEFDLSEPGAILDKATDLVLETFEKSVDEVKDGMDISLLSIQVKSELSQKSKEIIVQWSGANNPLWYIQNNELKEIKADKQPIGKSDHRKSFTTHTIPYTAGTTFYLFTDGYADQFGGPHGKKFMYKQLQELLLNIHTKTPQEQQTILTDTFHKWKGNLEQIDDVCMIGIQL